MLDSSGDQGFLPKDLTDCPLPYLSRGLDFDEDDTPLPEQIDLMTTLTISTVKIESNVARKIALDQQGKQPEKVAPMTKERLSFLTARRKEFEEKDGKDRRLRRSYVSARPMSSDANLESLAESTSCPI